MEILTIEQAAELLLCDKETAAERLNKGELPGLKFGRSWVIPATAFYQRLNELALAQADERRGLPLMNPTPSEPPRKRGRRRFTE